MGRPEFEKRPEITKKVRKSIEEGRILRWIAHQCEITPQGFYYKLKHDNWTDADIENLKKCGAL